MSAKPAPERTPPPAIGGEGAGWEWINWVRAGVRDGSVPVNAAGAWLHNIEGEAYVVSPACFEAFAAGRDLAPATVRNRVVRLGRHHQRASPSGSANVFRAVLADGSRVKGMVFPGELVWDVSVQYRPWLRDGDQCGGGSWWWGARSERMGTSANSDFHIRGVSSMARLAGCALMRWSTSTR